MMVTDRYTVYSEGGDMTFIMEERATEVGTEIEVVGFYFGQPTDENTKFYSGITKGIISEEDWHFTYGDMEWDATIMRLKEIER